MEVLVRARHGAGRVVYLRLMNYRHIRVLYGASCCEELMRRISEHLYSIGFRFLLRYPDEFVVATDSSECDVESLALFFSGSSFSKSGIVPVLCLAEVIVGEVGSFNVSSLVHETSTSVLLNSPEFNHRWRAKYESDMEVCHDVIQLLERGEIELSLQEIKDVTLRKSLYSEALFRLPNDYGIADTQGVINAFENVGLIRLLDRYVVISVIEYLKKHRQVSVACNVSAQSFVMDCWWLSVIAELKRHPGVARRLILELTEGSNIFSIKEFLSFVSRFREFGVKFVLDDFGAGMPRLVLIKGFKFDYIKLDKNLIAVELEGGLDRYVLKSLVTYLQAYCDGVVVEGVEGASDLAVAETVGAKFVQGYFVDVPSVNDRVRVFDYR